MTTTNQIVLGESSIVRAMIQGVSRDIRNVETTVQAAAMQCILHSHVHGNVNLASELMAIVTNEKGKTGIKGKNLENYLTVYGAIRKVETGKGKDKAVEWKLDRSRRNPNIMADTKAVTKILEMQWFNCRAQKPVEPVKFETVGKSIEKFIKAVNANDKPIEMSALDIAEAIRKLQQLQTVAAQRESAAVSEAQNI